MRVNQKLSYTLWLTVLDWTYYTGLPSWGAWGEPGNESHFRVQQVMVNAQTMC